MVSYGSWQPQGSDYLQFHTIFGDSSAVDPVDGLPLFEYGYGSQTDESGWQDPAYEITELDLQDVVNASQSEVDGGGTATTWGTGYGWGYNLSHPLVNATWGAGVVKRRFRITHAPYSYNPVSEGFWEPGAIGIDYEGQPYSPANPWASGPAATVSRGIAATSPTRLRGEWYESNGGVLRTEVPAADTEVVFVPGGGGGEVTLDVLSPPLAPSDGANPLTVSLPGDIDLTPYLAPGVWTGVLWTRSLPLFAPPVADPGAGSGEVRYGWGFDDVRIDTMVRPPRWRWVFEGEEPPAYRRVFPRDDGLAGGAPRNYPRSKSMQSGNRISGGYL